MKKWVLIFLSIVMLLVLAVPVLAEAGTTEAADTLNILAKKSDGVDVEIYTYASFCSSWFYPPYGPMSEPLFGLL